VTAKEPFQFTTESRRKSSPLTVNRNWLLSATVLVGEIEVTDEAGGQVPQDKVPTSMTFDLPSPPSKVLEFHDGYCNLAYSALACFRMGMCGSASFQSVRKS